MPHRIFEQSRQRTWLAMGREKEDREKDRVSDGKRERERNIIWLLYKRFPVHKKIAHLGKRKRWRDRFNLALAN